MKETMEISFGKASRFHRSEWKILHWKTTRKKQIMSTNPCICALQQSMSEDGEPDGCAQYVYVACNKLYDAISRPIQFLNFPIQLNFETRMQQNSYVHSSLWLLHTNMHVQMEVNCVCVRATRNTYIMKFQENMALLNMKVTLFGFSVGTTVKMGKEVSMANPIQSGVLTANKCTFIDYHK